MTSARSLSHATTALALASLLVLRPAAAQPVAVTAAPAAPAAFDFSGVIYGNFRYTYDDATKNANGGNATNKFDIERVYLNFRMPAGDDGSIRVTTDVFNNTVSGTSCVGCYAGWNVRLKYAYFQYNFLHDIGGSKGFNAVARVGMLHTSIIDHEEGFYPRWVSQVALERNGFFSSSDLGVAGLLTLPNKWGELYATVTNGPGYGTVENDPYKDWSARLSLTPLANQDNILKTFTISPWFYMGKTASKFLTTAGSAGTPAADGLTRDRAGVFVGLKDRRLTVGAEWGQRTETVETGATLATRGTYDNSGTVTSGFLLLRPIELFSGDPKARSSFGIHARLDNFKPFSDQRSAGATTGTQTTSSSNQLVIAGLFWDINQRSTLSLDIQNMSPQSGSTTAESKVFFAHWQVAF